MSLLNAVTSLKALDLRDRWGYRLDEDRLLELAVYVHARPDIDADSLALAMFVLSEVPMVCEDYDTPADDPLLETIIEAVRNRPTL